MGGAADDPARRLELGGTMLVICGTSDGVVAGMLLFRVVIITGTVFDDKGLDSGEGARGPGTVLVLVIVVLTVLSGRLAEAAAEEEINSGDIVMVLTIDTCVVVSRFGIESDPRIDVASMGGAGYVGTTGGFGLWLAEEPELGGLGGMGEAAGGGIFELSGGGEVGGKPGQLKSLMRGFCVSISMMPQSGPSILSFSN
jgi:hypothetical protein